MPMLQEKEILSRLTQIPNFPEDLAKQIATDAKRYNEIAVRNAMLSKSNEENADVSTPEETVEPTEVTASATEVEVATETPEAAPVTKGESLDSATELIKGIVETAIDSAMSKMQDSIEGLFNVLQIQQDRINDMEKALGNSAESGFDLEKMNNSGVGNMGQPLSANDPLLKSAPVVDTDKARDLSFFLMPQMD